MRRLRPELARSTPLHAPCHAVGHGGFPPSYDCLHGDFRPVQTTCRSSSLSCDHLTLRARPSGELHLTVPCINSFHRHERSKLDVEARVEACSKKYGLSNLVWHHHSWLNSMDAKLIRPHQHFIRRVSDRVAEYTISGQRQLLISAAARSPAWSPDSVPILACLESEGIEPELP